MDAFFHFTKILLLLTLTGFIFPLRAQTGQIEGNIRDADTGEELAFTHVFINHTTLGAPADANGHFILQNIPIGSNEIIVSFIGYQTHTQVVQVTEGETRHLNIRLKPDNRQLADVQVSDERDREWEKQRRYFEKIFLGTTPFARSCRILNPWVLEFLEEKIEGELFFTATASAPLEVENSALGYKVVYYLHNLLARPDAYVLTGEVRFEPLYTTDPETALYWEQNRLAAYRGSYRHLFKSLLDGQAGKEGFNLYYHSQNVKIESAKIQSPSLAAALGHTIHPFSSDQIVRPGKIPGEFNIHTGPELEVHYTKSYTNTRIYPDVSFPVSWLSITGGEVVVNRLGVILNPGSLVVSGQMYEARIANLLPYDYLPGESGGNLLTAENYTQERLLALMEKPYLHTDKPYYYAGEKIWFKAYMNYTSPELMDSLSRVLYVELINSQKEIVRTQCVKIEGGAAVGTLELHPQIPTGTYYLRAYTQWMLNFGDDLIYLVPVPLLDPYERVVTTGEPGASPNNDVRVTLETDKKSYQTRDKIELTIQLTDTVGNPLHADFSVSVTDAQQVVSWPGQHQITDYFAFPPILPPTAVLYPVETGISISGHYQTLRKTPGKTDVTIVQGKLEDFITIETDETGHFRASGFQFDDSVQLSFQPGEAKKKHYGMFTLLNRQIPPVRLPRVAPPASIVREESRQQYKPWDDGANTTMLEAVEIKSTREEIKRPQTIYGTPDISLNSERILATNRTSLLSAMQAWVPGLRVLHGGKVIIGPPNTYSSQDPLVILDGVPISPADSTFAVGHFINSLNPNTIARIDVIKFGGAAIYGSRGSSGVIIIQTKSGDYYAGNPHKDAFNDTYFHTEKILGYTTAAAFKSPDYGQPASRNSFADYRSTVYWAPRTLTDKATGMAGLSFYAADRATRYRIVIEGVTSSGAPFRQVSYIAISAK